MKIVARVILALAAAGVGWFGLEVVLDDGGFPCSNEQNSRLDVVGWMQVAFFMAVSCLR